MCLFNSKLYEIIFERNFQIFEIICSVRFFNNFQRGKKERQFLKERRISISSFAFRWIESKKKERKSIQLGLKLKFKSVTYADLARTQRQRSPGPIQLTRLSSSSPLKDQFPKIKRNSLKFTSTKELSIWQSGFTRKCSSRMWTMNQPRNRVVSLRANDQIVGPQVNNVASPKSF